MRYSAYIAVVFVILVTTGCTVVVGDGTDRDQAVAIEFGKVISLQAIDRSAAGEADVAGGVIALPGSDTDIARRVASERAFMYTIRKTSGETLTYATEKQFIVAGDCVAIEQGWSVNLRLVADRMCSGDVAADLEAQFAQAAAQCQVAKRELMLAQNETELASASEHVAATCQYRR